MSDTIAHLQQWFANHCDGKWERHKGVLIQTTDNPGWWVKINLEGTELRSKVFAEIKRGELSNDPQPPWLHCYVEDGIFNGAGDTSTLEEILDIFLRWTTPSEALRKDHDFHRSP